MTNFWDQRYSQDEFVYGKTPNVYFQEKLDALDKKGRIIFAAEGEGRNAVYAAKSGWEVYACDQSQAGRDKAMKLAEEHQVTINYEVGNIENLNLEKESYDALALIYAHFPENKRKAFHQQLSSALKVGGYLILEAFDKKHQTNQLENPKAGGPRDITMLYDLERIKEDFEGFEFVEILSCKTKLSEGAHHVGDADVIRVLAIKK